LHQTETILVDAPAADVWKLVGSIEGWEHWNSGISNVELLADQLGPGAEFAYRYRDREVRTTVDAYEEGRLLSIASDEGSYDFGESLVVEPEGEQTRVTFTMGFEPTVWWAKAASVLLVPFKDRVLGKPLRKELATLKHVAEEGTQ
jgi:uncharacterized membrane protein